MHTPQTNNNRVTTSNVWPAPTGPAFAYAWASKYDLPGAQWPGTLVRYITDYDAEFIEFGEFDVLSFIPTPWPFRCGDCGHVYTACTCPF